MALGGLGVPLGALGAPSGAPSGRKSGKNTELCDRYVAKAGRVMKTGSPDPPNVVKTWQMACFSYIQHSGTLATKNVAEAPQKWAFGVPLGTPARLQGPCVRTECHQSRIATN